MSPEGERILQVYRDRGLRSGALIHPAEFGYAIVWEDGFVRDEPVRAALGELFDGGYRIEHATDFELTDLGDQRLYEDDDCIVGLAPRQDPDMAGIDQAKLGLCAPQGPLLDGGESGVRLRVR